MGYLGSPRDLSRGERTSNEAVRMPADRRAQRSGVCEDDDRRRK